MTNVQQMIRQTARQKQVRQDIVEKDYAISYLMASLATISPLSDMLVMKGGTALKKLYFGEYRFSEDLDYSTRESARIPPIVFDKYIDQVVNDLVNQLNKRGPFQVVWETLKLKHPHPGGQQAYVVRIQFPGQRYPMCRLKVEITVDEPILAPISYCRIQHDYALEEFSVKVPSYSLKEITAEKLRTLLQVRIRLQTRGWGASRICRDYYDLWHLLRTDVIKKDETLIPLLKEKCAVRDVSFESPLDFITDNLRAVAVAEWDQQLLPFVPTAPGALLVLSEVEQSLQEYDW
jgi:hypothetical protein